MFSIGKFVGFFATVVLSLTPALASQVVMHTDDSIQIHVDDIRPIAEQVSFASVEYAKELHCQRNCRKHLRKAAKAYSRLLKNEDIDSQEEAEQVLAIVLSMSHDMNQKATNPYVHGLLTNPSASQHFQQHLVKAINGRKFKLWHGALLVVAAATIVVASFAVVTYAVGSLFAGAYVNFGFGAMLVAGVAAGSVSYYFVAQPLVDNYNDTHVQAELVQELEAYLQSIGEGEVQQADLIQD